LSSDRAAKVSGHSVVEAPRVLPEEPNDFAGLSREMEVVRECLVAAQARIPVHGVVCFVGAEWPLVFRRPVRMRGVTALWPTALGELVGKAGPFDTTVINETAKLLADVLKPA